MSDTTIATQDNAAIASFIQGGGAIAQNMASGGSVVFTPYVTFAHPLSPSWGKFIQAIPTLNTGDPVLIQQDPVPPMKLQPMQFFMFACQQFFCVRKDSDPYDLLQCYSPEQFQGMPPSRDIREEVETAILVFLNGKLVPANCCFRTTKSGAAKTAAEAARLAVTPEWAGFSEAHKRTLEISTPWARFVTTVEITRKQARGSGRKLDIANGRSAPTTLEQQVTLKSFIEDETNHKAMANVWSAYNRRIDEYKSKMK